MAAERTIVVGVEDAVTAGLVGTAAAHVAIDRQATAVILLHVVDLYAGAGALLSMSGVVPVVAEAADNTTLAPAEAALRAEYVALNRPLPAITRTVSAGAPGAVIAQIAEQAGAAVIVLGARRPHAFGRLVHPDVRSSVTHCTRIPVRVAALQADETESRKEP